MAANANAPENNGKVHPEIAKVLRERGIDPKLASVLQLGYLERDETTALMGDALARVPAVAIPYLEPGGAFSGFTRAKLLEPYTPKGGKARKYLQPKGTKNALYFPPLLDWAAIAADPSIPIWITEGEFKAVAACQLGLPCVALGGVWSWRTRGDDDEEDSSPIPDLNRITWTGRESYIAFDSDAATNPNIQRAQRSLAKHLFDRGADPRLFKVPHINGAEKTGFDDWLKSLGKRATKAVEAQRKQAESPYTLQAQSASELADKKFKPRPFVVEGLLPVGLTVLSGPPKLGKSFLALQLAHAVATGQKALGHYGTKPGTALYAALEDDESRLQSRMRLMKLEPSDQLFFVYRQQLQVGDEGVAQLIRWCESHPETKLIIVDTFGKFRKSADLRKQQLYDVDVAVLSAIKNVADVFGVAIVLIHHLRKGAADDVFDRVSGSTGITGTADTNMVMLRDRLSNDAYLHLTGRDVPEQERALKFDAGIWTDVGEANSVRTTSLEQQVIDALRDHAAPMQRKEIAGAINRRADGSLDRTLFKLIQLGRVKQEGRGSYVLGAEEPARNPKF